MDNLGLEQFPLGFWATIDAAQGEKHEPREWAEMGMSLTMGYCYTEGESDKAVFREFLDDALNNNIKIILCDSRISVNELKEHGIDNYKKRISEVLKDWGDHQAIWGARIGDEPNAKSYPYFIEAIKTLREMAPQWQPYANLLPYNGGTLKAVGHESWDEYLDTYLKDSGMKFLSYDCYGQMDNYPEAIPWYFENLKLFGDASRRNNVPFWTFLLSVPHFTYRKPNLDEYRWQLNTAVASGARGISWFYLHQQSIWFSNYRDAPINQLGRKTQGYFDISDVQNIFRRTIAPYMQRLEIQKIYHLGEALGGFTLFEGDEEIEKPEWKDKMIMTYLTDPSDPLWKYVLIVNNSQHANIRFKLCIKGKNVVAEELVQDEIWRSLNGTLCDDGEVERTEENVKLPHWYAPGQAVLYRYHR